VTTVRVRLPHHLRTLARVEAEVRVEVEGAPTIRGVLDALEARHPTLRGTIRDHTDGERRAYLRYFADGSDLSHEPQEAELPAGVAAGDEPFIVLGAIAGG
jgi:hypothetical protein